MNTNEARSCFHYRVFSVHVVRVMLACSAGQSTDEKQPKTSVIFVGSGKTYNFKSHRIERNMQTRSSSKQLSGWRSERKPLETKNERFVCYSCVAVHWCGQLRIKRMCELCSTAHSGWKSALLLPSSSSVVHQKVRGQNEMERGGNGAVTLFLSTKLPFVGALASLSVMQLPKLMIGNFISSNFALIPSLLPSLPGGDCVMPKRSVCLWSPADLVTPIDKRRLCVRSASACARANIWIGREAFAKWLIPIKTQNLCIRVCAEREHRVWLVRKTNVATFRPGNV